MKAVILVGGLGTRLRPLTFAIPKPLLAIGEKPMLQHTIEHLRACGVTEILLATGYLAELIEAFCGDGSRFGVRIQYHRESKALGTAGPLTLMRNLIAPDEFVILMNGDIVTDLSFGDLVEFARSNGNMLTVAYTQHTYHSPYGVLEIVEDQILKVIEKPEIKNFVSCGIYVVKGSALEHIPDGEYFTVPDLIAALRGAGHAVGAYQIPGFWLGVEDLTHMDEVRARLPVDKAPVAS